MPSLTLLQKLRVDYRPKLPKVLQQLDALVATNAPDQVHSKVASEILSYFPILFNQPILSFSSQTAIKHQPKRVGVVLSGGQAAGGHNVIIGLHDALKKLHPKSCLFGFKNGPNGIVNNQLIELTSELLNAYRNQGGFDLIGSGRTKIESAEQFQAALNTVQALDLDGLVIIGGDDSNTNAALLAEYFLQKGCKTKVVGVPKTIDGDLKNEQIEISFGFDTASKIYSEIIGNLMRDTLSAQKSYYFIKLMGRAASHLNLECALQTHPNLALISEELAADQMTLQDVIEKIADLICKRALLGKEYGVILIPEGVIEFIPEFKQLIEALNELLAPGQLHAAEMDALTTLSEKVKYIHKKLEKSSADCFERIPAEIQTQLLLDRDPHGNVQVAKIETERLLIEMVKQELKKRKSSGKYVGKFSAQPHYCGYEGRSGMPSNFDAQYCYALGYVAALLIESGATGYMSCVQHLTKPVEEWTIVGIPLVSMMAMEQRRGKSKPVIRKALVDLKGSLFKAFKEQRDAWALEDAYRFTGPMQFFGPPELTEAITFTLAYEHA